MNRGKKEGIYNHIVALVDCTQYLCISLQEKLPYNIENVKSNDSLYTDLEYKTAIFQSLEGLLKEVQEHTIELSSQGMRAKNDQLVIETNLYTINNLLIYILPCQRLKDIIKYSLVNIKNVSSYLKDKSVKNTTLPNYIRNSFRNIVKHFPVIYFVKLYILNIHFRMVISKA